jgi:hypothetical protein
LKQDRKSDYKEKLVDPKESKQTRQDDTEHLRREKKDNREWLRRLEPRQHVAEAHQVLHEVEQADLRRQNRVAAAAVSGGEDTLTVAFHPDTNSPFTGADIKNMVQKLADFHGTTTDAVMKAVEEEKLNYQAFVNQYFLEMSLAKM